MALSATSHTHTRLTQPVSRVSMRESQVQVIQVLITPYSWVIQACIPTSPPPAPHKLRLNRQRTAPHAFPVMRFLGTALQFCSLTVVAYAG